MGSAEKASETVSALVETGDGDGGGLSPWRRNRGKIVLGVVFTVVAGWLYLVPPFIHYGVQGSVACRPLGPGMTGRMVINVLPSYPATSNAVDDSLGQFKSKQFADLEARLGLSEACEQARANQQTALIIVLAGGVATLVGL